MTDCSTLGCTTPICLLTAAPFLPCCRQWKHASQLFNVFITDASLDTFEYSTQGWTRLAKAVNADSKVSNRIVYDILNEPDAFNVKFEPQNGRPGMRDLYFSAFDAIYAVNPGTPHLIF